MSISVFLISLFFALVEAGLSFLFFAFEPVARLVGGIPSFVLIGAIFALGMLLAFLLIILIGSMNLRCRAASFVRDYFGRTLALALISVLVLGVLATGAELLYQFRPNAEADVPAGYIRVADPTAVADTLLTPRQTYSLVPDASEIEQNVQAAGGNTDAPLRFSIMWNEPERAANDNNDVDAHCKAGGDHIYYGNQTGASTGGVLDIDITQPVIQRPNGAAVENIVFTNADKIKGKTFEFYILCFADNMGTTGFRAEIDLGDTVYTYDYPQKLTQKQNVPVADVTVDAEGNMSIVHHLNYVNVETITPEVPETEGRSFLSIVFGVNSAVVRCILLGVLTFLFKLISSVCIGMNNRNFLVHLVTSLLIAIVASLAVEFGYFFGLPVWAVLAIFWVLLTVHIVPAD